MITIRQFIWSLRIDYTFLFKVKDIPIYEKLYFIFLKYTLFLKDKILGINKIQSVPVFGKNFYYSDIYGLASIQRVYCESYHLKKYIKENSIVIDVGAHIGQFCFFCHHYLKAKRIVSIEPIAECFELLKLNSFNPEDCKNYAISKDEGIVTIYVPASSSQESSYIKSDKKKYKKSFSVTAKRLDDVMDELDIKGCDLLKIDTEGSEYDVLLSAQNLLDKTDLVIVEMSVYRASAGNLFAVGNFLQTQGFSLIKLLPMTSDLSFIDGIFKRVR
jgi:FkbM family methyltransferase